MLEPKKRRSSAKTLEAREDEMVALAVNLAEKQLREGTASSQVISHYLKIGSVKDRLEREILGEQKKLITAKTESIQSQKKTEELYKNALAAMRSYGGSPKIEEDSDDY